MTPRNCESEVMKTVSYRLRLNRESRGLTKKQLEDLSGINISVIGRIEQGTYRHIPSTTTLLLLANGLNVDLVDLLK